MERRRPCRFACTAGCSGGGRGLGEETAAFATGSPPPCRDNSVSRLRDCAVAADAARRALACRMLATMPSSDDAGVRSGGGCRYDMLIRRAFFFLFFFFLPFKWWCFYIVMRLVDLLCTQLFCFFKAAGLQRCSFTLYENGCSKKKKRKVKTTLLRMCLRGCACSRGSQLRRELSRL